MSSVKWPRNVSADFHEQFSALPPEVFDQLVGYVDSGVNDTEKTGSIPLLVHSQHEQTLYTISLVISFTQRGDDKIITKFEGHPYTVPLP